MQVKSLNIQGFKSIVKNTHFDFPNGFISFQGQNGYGKSSCMEAIQLILFDKSNSKLEDLVNEKSDNFLIELEFSHEGHDYRLCMDYDLKSKKTSREIYIDDETSPSYNTVSDSVQYLSEILDPSIAYYGMFLMQDSFELLEAKDAQRLELFKKIKNLDYTKQALQIKAVVDDLEKDKIQLEAEINILKNKTFTKEDLRIPKKTETEIKELEKELKQVETALNSIESVKKAKSQLESSLEREEKNLNDTQKENKSLTEKMSITTKEIDKCFADRDSKKNEKERKEKEFKDKLLKLNEFLDSIEKDIKQDYENQKSIKTSLLAEKEMKLEEIKPLIRRIKKVDYDTKIADIIGNKSRISTQIKSNQEALDAHRKGGKCPLCHSELGGFSTESIEKEIKTLNDSLLSYEETLKNLKLEKEKQQVIFDEISEATETKKQLDIEIKNLNESLTSIDDSIEKDIISKKESLNKEIKNTIENNDITIKAIDDTIKSIDEKRARLDQDLIDIDTRYSKNKEQIDSFFKSIESIKKEIKELSIEDTQALEERKVVIDSYIKDYYEILYHNKMVAERNDNIDKEKIENESLINDKTQELQKTISSIADNKEARQVLLKHFPNYVIQETITDVENSINNFISDVYNKDLNISLRATSTSLKLEYGNSRKRDCRNLSGAEKILVTLGFINSLNEQLDLGILFLDEADQALSQENTERLFDILQNMNYNQLILITHNNFMKGQLLADGAKVYEFVNEGIVEEVN